MRNRNVDVTSETYHHLGLALQLALPDGAIHYGFHEAKQRVLGECCPDTPAVPLRLVVSASSLKGVCGVSMALPYCFKGTQLQDFIWGWLQQTQYVTDLKWDGDARKGFRVALDTTYAGVCVVTPEWACFVAPVLSPHLGNSELETARQQRSEYCPREQSNPCLPKATP